MSFFSRQPRMRQTIKTTANTLPTIATEIMSGDPISQPIPIPGVVDSMETFCVVVPGNGVAGVVAKVTGSDVMLMVTNEINFAVVVKDVFVVMEILLLPPVVAKDSVLKLKKRKILCMH